MLDFSDAKDATAIVRIRAAVVVLLGRTRLFGLTVLGSAIRVREKEVETMCTDGRTIWYAPSWVHAKSIDSIAFDLCHEALHIFGNHPARRGNRDDRYWNYAADVRVAHDCLKIFRASGPWELDKDHVKDHSWAQFMTVEEIYEAVVKDPQKMPEDYTPDLVAPSQEETPAQSNEFRRKLTEDLTKATIAEEQAGKDVAKQYGTAVWERLQELRRCDVPWHVLLQGRLCAALGHERVTWSPLNKRWLPDFAMPTRRGSMEDELLLGIDISGSITDTDLARFRACVLPAARRAKRTTVVTFDQTVREVITSTRPEVVLRDLKFKTGSHRFTDVQGVFLEVDKRKPSAVAIITDGYIRLPDRAYPAAHWILTPEGRAIPWGRTYRLHASW